MFTEADPLPSAQSQTPLGDRYGQGWAHQRCFDVGWHVVGPFKCVAPVRRIFAHGVIKPALEIAAHLWACVLVDRQRRRGVVDKEME